MTTANPLFVQLAGHPLRWGLLRELAQSDRKVRELAAILRQRQGLVSYHLGRLRAGRLVSMRRSSADKRDAYYTIDLERCRELIAATADALHPGIQLEPVPAPEPILSPDAPPVRALFLCTGNSARSQMAEALLRARAGRASVVASAGSKPKPLHPLAVSTMAERGLDISRQRPRHMDELDGQAFDVVITLCDRVREVCPQFSGAPRMVHWSIPDPSVPPADDGDHAQIFRAVADELTTRIDFLLRDIARSQQKEAPHG